MLALNIVAISNICILFLLLFFRRENVLPNKLLAVLFLVPGLYFVNTLFILSEQWAVVPFSLYTVQAVAISFPILVHLYFNQLLGDGKKIHPVLFIGSGGLLVMIVVLAFSYGGLSDGAKMAYVKSLATDDYPLDMLIYTTLFYFWQLVYFSAITKRLWDYRKRIKARTATMDGVQFLYLKRFITLLWSFTAMLVVMYIVFPLVFVDYLLLPIVVNVLYVFILYFSYNYNAIFTNESFGALSVLNVELNEAHMPVLVEDSNEPETSEKQQEAYKKITSLLEKNKAYTQPDLNLKNMAEMVGEPGYLVSQVINHFFKKSFFELINEYRINEALHRLKSMSRTETIEGIAYDTGFNSRSSFYRVFKKHTGKSPQDYIKQN